MAKKIYVFDPTIADQQSRVRGIGRYLQIMKENFVDKFIFIGNKNITQDSVLINPFFNFLSPPFSLHKIAQKQIAVIHDLIPLKFPEHFPIGIKGEINIMLNKFSLRHYDLIVVTTQTVKNDLVNLLKISPNKIKIITPTLPKIFWENQTTPLHPAEGDFTEQANNYYLYVGDATWNKNLVNLAKAIKLANVKCVFVGKVFKNSHNLNHPWQKELKNFYQEIKSDSHFILKGFVSDQELIQLYRNARCNLFVSHDEGFGFSYLEAISQKCPSILADIPVFREIAQQNAVLVNQKNPQLIAEKIKTIANDNQPVDLSRFSVAQFIQGWQQCLDSL
jgi:glycosyltransferase involved in cell wall biosynthesis